MLNPFLVEYSGLLAGTELAMTSSDVNIKEESCVNCGVGLCRLVINKVQCTPAFLMLIHLALGIVFSLLCRLWNFVIIVYLVLHKVLICHYQRKTT
ncbi:hypothetical protein MTR67_051049 [Solanum verrucosum]|uniref:Uncharacterized protein n=1 Tax=Solanum verrucosum TaxID=315347 RepID=A0AAF1A2E8_SOLVR|nr:hypothetical protein MTR67_051049 [Solanum verrucosum]